MSLADPWSSGSSDSNNDAAAPSLQFEDNFEPSATGVSVPGASSSDIQQPRDGRLPDSDSYLAVLERRLRRIKTNPTVLQQLVERREACMQHLLNDSSIAIRGDSELALDEPVNHHELLRFIRPEQALSVAELVHIVKYDHLEQEPTESDQLQDSGKEGEESGTESSTSR
ncbi:coiled-coil domain-containing protein 32 [Ochlerotatus camptorhynchus]|uniref:coiled-coil domain-containing protein 32 n=1 Tax=Ochlerotatus camptorhynchus TaxID=644619 RepID=UPI0031D6DEB3